MEPRHEEKKDREPRAESKEAKPRRFRIVKLEERIAPGRANGNGTNNTCGVDHKSSPWGCFCF
jgi:hypothetical protein